jgi:hypothetical protein
MVLMALGDALEASLAAGLARAQLLVQFSESPENQNNILPAIQNGIWMGCQGSIWTPPGTLGPGAVWLSTWSGWC